MIEVVRVGKDFVVARDRATTLKQHVLHPLRRAASVRLTALDDISFGVGRGEFFGVIGPNGSGKSTLLRVLAGIYPPTRGTVRVEGRLSSLIELGVGFNPDLDVVGNIRVNATLLGLPAAAVARLVEPVLEFAELDGVESSKLKNLSTGMQMRLAYAIAMQVPFDVLLVDEALAVGDVDFQWKCIAELHRFREEGRTIVMVSHLLPLVERFCDRTLVLRGGRVVAIGPSAEVVPAYGRPLFAE